VLNCDVWLCWRHVGVAISQSLYGPENTIFVVSMTGFSCRCQQVTRLRSEHSPLDVLRTSARIDNLQRVKHFSSRNSKPEYSTVEQLITTRKGGNCGALQLQGQWFWAVIMRSTVYQPTNSTIPQGIFRQSLSSYQCFLLTLVPCMSRNWY